MVSISESTTINIPLLGEFELPIPDGSVSVKETRMSQLLSSWTISHAWNGLVGHDGKVKFKGFAKIFESL